MSPNNNELNLKSTSWRGTTLRLDRHFRIFGFLIHWPSNCLWRRFSGTSYPLGASILIRGEAEAIAARIFERITELELELAAGFQHPHERRPRTNVTNRSFSSVCIQRERGWSMGSVLRGLSPTELSRSVQRLDAHAVLTLASPESSRGARLSVPAGYLLAALRLRSALQHIAQNIGMKSPNHRMNPGCAGTHLASLHYFLCFVI
ncbi:MULTISPECIES: hypothetical protein [unclassified Bradyrhizobium]|uniref:hypothetical protein n=1 Tax=unclassified Bradyrhizobium TaxID=2631580 RepID=UPI001FFAEB43|nr:MULTISPECIES: hypothetical protein [unclassified Bradyrhizobium]MCK1521823.1 hypothetical protein [Bradyrhizobium sp. 17]MCK1688136.1 hypothetical protein [Bradyrhizobium sp. 145]UPJ99972.1 hypothetical protein IVB07_08030 [Bradyrhizobium sp. 172]